MKKSEIIGITSAALSVVLAVLILFSFSAGEKDLSVTLVRHSAAVPETENAGDASAEPGGAVPLESFVAHTPPYIKMVPGGTFNVSVERVPENSNEKLTWKSSAPYIADVSQSGVITAISRGVAAITVEGYNGAGLSRVIIDVVRAPDELLDVPYITQIYDYPNGCESVSTVMALNYEGIDISVDDFIEKYLDMAPLPEYVDGELWGYSPWFYFLGDPRDMSGLCCYAPCIVNALNKFVDTEKYEILELYGESIEDLCANYVKQGDPVIFWGTMYMNAPSVPGWNWNVYGADDTYYWVDPMHCLLLVGYDKDNYYFNDPTAGKSVAYSKSDVEAAYDGLYQQAVVVRHKPESE